MKYEEYKISKEEKLEDLAWRFELTLQELQELNPKIETFKKFWGTETYAVVNQLIKVPAKETKDALLGEIKSLLVNEDDKYSKEKVGFDFNKSQEERQNRLSEEERFLKNPYI